MTTLPHSVISQQLAELEQSHKKSKVGNDYLQNQTNNNKTCQTAANAAKTSHLKRF